MRMLLVEDDPGLCNTLERGLGESGNVVDVTHDGKAGIFYAQNPILNISGCSSKNIACLSAIFLFFHGSRGFIPRDYPPPAEADKNCGWDQKS